MNLHYIRKGDLRKEPVGMRVRICGYEILLRLPTSLYESKERYTKLVLRFVNTVSSVTVKLMTGSAFLCECDNDLYFNAIHDEFCCQLNISPCVG